MSDEAITFFICLALAILVGGFVMWCVNSWEE